MESTDTHTVYCLISLLRGMRDTYVVMVVQHTSLVPIHYEDVSMETISGRYPDIREYDPIHPPDTYHGMGESTDTLCSRTSYPYYGA